MDPDDKFFTGWFIFAGLISLAWLGFLVWVILRIVGWLVTK